jgi:hypothetical protein
MRRLLFLVAFALAAGCGGDDPNEQHAGVARSDAEQKAEERAKKAEDVDGTPLSRVEVSKGTTREGAEAWLVVYADASGEFGDLCVWVNANGVEADDCPGYAGVAHATARVEGEAEAAKREKELGIELEFVELRRGEAEGHAAWEAVYRDPSAEYKDLCVWVQTDPEDEQKNLITSDDC